MATVSKERRGYGRLLLGVGLAVVLLGGLAMTLDVRAIGRALADADPGLVALAAGLSLSAQLCWSLTTATILEGVDGSLPRRRIQLGYLSGTFGKQVLPLGNVGGSAILSYVIAEDLDRRFRDVFAAVTASELLVFAGSVGVAVAGLVSILLSPYSGLPTALVLAVLTVTVLVLVVGGAVLAYRIHLVATFVEHVAWLLRVTLGRISVRVHRSLAPERVGSGTRSFLDAFGTATGETRRLVVATTLAVLGWLAFSLALSVGLLAVGAPMPLGFALFLTPAAGVVTLLPTPGGLGSTEIGLTAALTVVLASSPAVVAAGVIVFRLVTYWLVVAVGGVSSLYLSATVWHALD
ncbi:flippase-like domain-containing protein [Haloarcula sp. S1CR25-12]|uniref:Flippase-like domain-containing protein n=1 Tax=Haloarcula saliterrae TaxID=2950534 RepID=A0ABU2FAZ1_9EURY|nr:lysylphosphatidylglycerol synthase transmembrane domain-containing protein [Haloarcula sp. S1CR25-12]MDS0258891.1 flippase-like domain-containing protein [Haloarcula sp. S1CR25-12]